MKSLFTVLALSATLGLCAAEATASTTATDSVETKTPFYKHNIKMNVSSLTLNNYSFSFERALTRKTSFVAGYRIMPNTVVGDMAVSKFLADKYLEDDNDLKDHLDKANFSNQAFTGELRYYTGKHAGPRGFYVGAYGRYTDMSFSYQDTYNTTLQNYDLPYKGKLTGFGGGLMVGAQWLVTNRITFDWYIAGAHYGNMGGDVNVAQDLSELPESEKRELEADVEERFTIGGRQLIDATVTDAGVHGKVDAPFFGIRGFGFNLGIAF